MTQGFYEQLGVAPAASLDEIRAAYTRVVGALLKRRKQVIEHGGDPEGLDVAHGQATEAWRVLSDPARRRRYDAMLALSGSDAMLDEESLWKAVSGALVHPAAHAAVDLLRTTTTLSLGELPPSPGEARSAAPPKPSVVRNFAPAEPEHTEHMTVVTQVPLTEVTEARPPRPRHIPPRVTPTSDFEPPARDASQSSIHIDGGEDAEPSVAESPVLQLRPSLGAERSEAASRPGFKVVDGQSSPAVMVLPTSPGTHQERTPMGTEDVRQLAARLGTSGALLRAVRERRGLSLQEMADATRISARYLEAIELEDFDALPSSTFVRGYVREMSRQLGLDEAALTKGYMRRFTP